MVIVINIISLTLFRAGVPNLFIDRSSTVQATDLPQSTRYRTWAHTHTHALMNKSQNVPEHEQNWKIK